MKVALAAVVAVLLLAPAAQAHRFFGGVVPDVPTGTQVQAQPRARIANLPYHRGPVLHSNRTHLIFWQPVGSGLTFDAGYESLTERFLRDVAADSHKPTNVYSLSGQYRDATGPAAYASDYGGATVATDRLPLRNGCTEPLLTGPGWTRCVDDSQLVAEIKRAINAHQLPRTDRDIYFILTPRGLGSCEFSGPDNCALGGDTFGSYCGYHSATAGGLLYAVIPYNAVPPHCQSDNPRPNSSTADPTISTLSHEHNETVTDPLGNAWIDGNFEEDGDLCLTDFGPPLGGSGATVYDEMIHRHRYYLQEEWSNRDGGCRARDEAEHASIKAPNRARAGVAVSFKGHARDPDGSISSYSWFFGDHHKGHGRRVKHVFGRAGSYRVVLRTSDRDAIWAFAARTIRIR